MVQHKVTYLQVYVCVIYYIYSQYYFLNFANIKKSWNESDTFAHFEGSKIKMNDMKTSSKAKITD